MALTNTAAVLDFLAERYGARDAVARAKLLEWLQAAAAEVWAAQDWWFKREEFNHAWIAAQAVYTLHEATEAVLDVFDVDGNLLDFVDLKTYNAVFRPSEPVAGVPRVWTLDSRDQSSGVLRLRVWPAPTVAAAGAAKMVRKVKETELEDDEDNKSRVPSEQMHVAAYRALQLLCQDEKQHGEADRYGGLYDKGLASMMADNKRRLGGLR